MSGKLLNRKVCISLECKSKERKGKATELTRNILMVIFSFIFANKNYNNRVSFHWFELVIIFLNFLAKHVLVRVGA